MKRYVKCSSSEDFDRIIEVIKNSPNWRDPYYLKGRAKDVWYSVSGTKGVNPDGTPSRILVARHIGNDRTGLYFEEEFLTSINDLLRRLTSPVQVVRESDGLFREGHKPVRQCEGVNRNVKKYVKSNNFDGTDSVHELLSIVPLSQDEMIQDIAVNVLQEMDQTGLSYGACKQDAITYFTDLVENYLDLFLYKEYDIDFDDSDTLQ